MLWTWIFMATRSRHVSFTFYPLEINPLNVYTFIPIFTHLCQAFIVSVIMLLFHWSIVYISNYMSTRVLCGLLSQNELIVEIRFIFVERYLDQIHLSSIQCFHNLVTIIIEQYSKCILALIFLYWNWLFLWLVCYIIMCILNNLFCALNPA